MSLKKFIIILVIMMFTVPTILYTINLYQEPPDPGIDIFLNPKVMYLDYNPENNHIYGYISHLKGHEAIYLVSLDLEENKTDVIESGIKKGDVLCYVYLDKHRNYIYSDVWIKKENRHEILVFDCNRSGLVDRIELLTQIDRVDYLFGDERGENLFISTEDGIYMYNFDKRQISGFIPGRSRIYSGYALVLSNDTKIIVHTGENISMYNLTDISSGNLSELDNYRDSDQPYGFRKYDMIYNKDENRLYYNDFKHIYRLKIDSNNNSIKRDIVLEADSQIFDFQIYKGEIFYISLEKGLYRFNLSTGKRVKLGDPYEILLGRPTSINNIYRLVINDRSGKLYCGGVGNYIYEYDINRDNFTMVYEI